jgi:hypothetical protein
MSKSIITLDANKCCESQSVNEYRVKPFELRGHNRLVVTIPNKLAKKYGILAGCSEVVIIDTGNELRLRIETRRSIWGA